MENTLWQNLQNKDGAQKVVDENHRSYEITIFGPELDSGFSLSRAQRTGKYDNQTSKHGRISPETN